MLRLEVSILREREGMRRGGYEEGREESVDKNRRTQTRSTEMKTYQVLERPFRRIPAHCLARAGEPQGTAYFGVHQLLDVMPQYDFPPLNLDEFPPHRRRPIRRRRLVVPVMQSHVGGRRLERHFASPPAALASEARNIVLEDVVDLFRRCVARVEGREWSEGVSGREEDGLSMRLNDHVDNRAFGSLLESGDLGLDGRDGGEPCVVVQVVVASYDRLESLELTEDGIGREEFGVYISGTGSDGANVVPGVNDLVLARELALAVDFKLKGDAIFGAPLLKAREHRLPCCDSKGKEGVSAQERGQEEKGKTHFAPSHLSAR
jgi:hypothetical protein